MTPLSYEEEVASEYIFKNTQHPIINICDFHNLKRNLFLTLQLMEINSNLILFINTFKNIKKIDKKEIKDCEIILNKLGINYFIGDAGNKKDINNFKIKLIKLINKNYIKFNLNKFNYLDIENIKTIKSIISENCISIGIDSNIAALRLVENDEKILNKLKLNNQKN